MASVLPQFGFNYVSIFTVTFYLMLRSMFVSRIAGDAFVPGSTKVVLNGSSEAVQLTSPASPLRVEIQYSTRIVSSWEILLIGVALGAFAMRCAMLDSWLHRFKVYPIGRAKSESEGWVFYDAGTSSFHEESSCDTASSRLLAHEPYDSSEVASVTRKADRVDCLLASTESSDTLPQEVDLQVTNTSPDEDAIKLKDLDDLEDYLYENAPPNVAESGPEPDDLPQFPDAMWKVSYSVDCVMRPIHSMFAPELEYQAMDESLSIAQIKTDAIKDNQEVVVSILQVLGRFAIRQDNLELLKKVYTYSSNVDQELLWQFMKVSIEYKKIHCFSYLLPFIKYAEAKARVLELCAHHNQVKMMQEAFEKWTEFIKSDTANAPLVVAATRGHIDSVQFLLTKCTNVEISIKSPYVDENYPTPLLAAAAGGYLAILRELVAAGAKTRQDIDSELPDPLLKGIATRNVAMLACLVEHNWSILNNRSDSIDTVLDIAIEHDHAELVEWTLLKSTINRSGYHKSRLRSACQRGHIEIMHMLLNYWAYSPELLPSHPEEAEVHQVDRYGPARSRHTLILELLREHCTKDSPISDAPSIVSRLAWMGDVRGLKRLFMDEPNVDVNVEDKYKKSPLFDAMHRHLRWRQGHLSGSPQQWLQITKMLLDRGAKFNMKDAWHLKALYGGVPKEIVEDLRNLVKNGKY